MDKMPIPTTDTVSIRQTHIHQLLEILRVNGTGMPYWMKNDIKTPVIMKKHPENHKKINFRPLPLEINQIF